MKDKVRYLFHPPEDECPRFLAMRIGECLHLDQITPHLMHWQENIWLMDLEATKSYWRQRALQEKQSLLDTLRPFLKNLNPQQDTPSVAFAEHPWQALLLLAILEEKKISGTIPLSSPLGKTLWNSLSWSTWFHCLRNYFDVNPNAQALSYLKKFQRFIAHSMLSHVTSLRNMEASAIHRRFGQGVATLWQWTFLKGNRASSQHAFPWVAWTHPIHPAVTRHLDATLRNTEEILPLFSEDLDRLCQHADWLPERHLLSLRWDLIDDDLQHKSLFIRYRHPHPLYQERYQHKTTLTIARALLEKEFSALLKIDDPSFCMRLGNGIVSWTLTIEKDCFANTWQQHLFPDEQRLSDLKQIDNQLPHSLERVFASADFLPEHCSVPISALEPWSQIFFIEADLGEGSEDAGLYRQRPLFLLRQPEIFKPATNKIRFLEKISNKWWQLPQNKTTADEAASSTRDYFLYVDPQGKRWWVYHEQTGTWYKHGIYS